MRASASERQKYHGALRSVGCGLKRCSCGRAAYRLRRELQSRDSLAAIGEYLRAVDSALAQLRQHPGDLDAMRDYDFALARVFSAIRKGNIDAWWKQLAGIG